MPALKAIDYAKVPPKPAQMRADELKAMYAGMVGNMRHVVQRLEEHGHSAELDSELKDQCHVMVGQLAFIFVNNSYI